MRKVVSRTSAIALAVASLSLATLGCDDQRTADKQVQQGIRDSRTARLKGDPEKAQQLLDQAAQTSTASKATQAHAKSLLAQAQVEAAIQQINDPKTGIEVGNTDISRLMFEISTLGQQIRSSNSLVASYAKYEPKPIKDMAQAQAAAATGGAGKDMWVGEGKSGIPTLTVVRQQIARLQGDVVKLQDQIKTLQTQQGQVSAQAQQAERAAAAAVGRAGVDAETKAANLRKQSSDLSNKAEVRTAQLAPLQSDLAVAQAREKALTSAVNTFAQLAAAYDAGWNQVEQQIVKQKQLAGAIYQGVGAAEAKASTNSITSKSIELQKLTEETQKGFAGAKDNLTHAVTNFQAAVTAADALQAELQTQLSDPSVRGTEMGKTIDAMKQAFNSHSFRLGQADAQQLLATLYTSRVTALAERQRLLAALQPVLAEAGLSMPKQLNDPNLATTIKDLTKEADAAYTAVTDLYTNVGEAGNNENQKTAGHIGRMFALYGHSQLKRAAGDAKGATALLTDARGARDLVIQEKGYAAIPAYPSDLVPPPATKPAAASPADATAPAEGATPAAPAEGTPEKPPTPAAPSAPANPAP